MSDERKTLLTPEGVYVQDEDGQGWTLLPGTEEHEHPVQQFTNEEAEKLFKTEMVQAEIRAAEEQLMENLREALNRMADQLKALGRRLRELTQPAVEAWRALWEQLQTLNAEAEKHPRKTQRPDYNASPKVRTRAKTKRQRKQRSRER